MPLVSKAPPPGYNTHAEQTTTQPTSNSTGEHRNRIRSLFSRIFSIFSLFCRRSAENTEEMQQLTEDRVLPKTDADRKEEHASQAANRHMGLSHSVYDVDPRRIASFLTRQDDGYQ